MADTRKLLAELDAQGEYFLPSEYVSSMGLGGGEDSLRIKAEVGSAIDDLERAGLVEWRVYEGMKRWSLTDEGHKALES